MENPFSDVLVELIVVLVILAILAAMMVPALLGWIDEARNKQYVLEARSVYMAAQAEADKAYGTGTSDDLSTILTDKMTEISTLAEVTVTAISATAKGTGKDAYKIDGMDVTFTSANKSTTVEAKLENGEWDVTPNPSE